MGSYLHPNMVKMQILEGYAEFEGFCLRCAALQFCRRVNLASYIGCLVGNKLGGTFRQVPTRRIRLSFVECAYSDLRDIFFFHNFTGLKWIPL